MEGANSHGVAMNEDAAMRFAGEAVLLVEDDPINQEVACEILAGAGLAVTVADNGRQAIAQLERQRFACVLMDVQMPEMDGLEATRLIRKDPRWQQLPIIAMTAGTLAKERQEAERAGMDDYITKPIDVAQLFATIARCLNVGQRAAEPRTAAVAKSVEWPGLDVESGLKSVFNKVSLYRKLLRAYGATATDLLGRFDAALAAGDREALKHLAHTLKGSAATLGLQAVCDAATAIEKADAAANAETLAALAALLRRQHALAQQSIARYLATD